MRVLVLEYVSGGGLAGRPCPAGLAREGAAMRAALLEDLARVPGLSLTATTDPRFPLAAPAGVGVVPVRPGDGAFARLLAGTDAVWLIAPESLGRLVRLARRVERAGKLLLGPGSEAIRLAADKHALLRRLSALGLPVPATRVVAARATPVPSTGAALRATAGVRARGSTRGGANAAAPGSGFSSLAVDGALVGPPLPFPVVLKPARGAGSEGVALARDAEELERALAAARAADPRGRILAQSYVPGMPASVSLLVDGRAARALAVNAQHITAGIPFTYAGGETPLAHPLAGRAVERALQACAAVPGLRGYVGVDLVLTERDAVILEINPRLTTSYLGIRRSLCGDVAALALEAALGRLPACPPPAIRHVRFDTAGAILDEWPLAAARPSPAGA